MSYPNTNYEIGCYTASFIPGNVPLTLIVWVSDGNIEVLRGGERVEEDTGWIFPDHKYNEDDLEYFLGCLLYYFDREVAWSNYDYYRAAQCCQLMGDTLPGVALLEHLIGYDPAHASLPDDWETVKARVEDLMQKDPQ